MPEFMGVTVTLPTGELLRYSREGFPGAAGFFEPRVQNLGRVQYQRSDVSGNVVLPTVQFRLEDHDDAFAARVARGERIQGARVDVDELISGTRHFSGEVRELSPDGMTAWTLRCGPRDAALSGDLPSTLLTLGDFPNIPKANLKKLAPWVWGDLDSAGVGGTTGSITCPLVDTVRFQYLVCFGWVTVMRMYRDSTYIQTGPTWATRHLTINGRRFTVVDFTTSQGSSVITVDVKGYMKDSAVRPPVGLPDTEGGATGGVPLAYVKEAGDVFMHMATNLLFQQNKTGVFANAPHADLDSAAFIAMNTEDVIVPYRVSVYLDQPTTGYAAIQEWCKATGRVITWDRLGRLTCSTPWALPTADFVSDPWFREDHADLLSVDRLFETRDRESKLVGVYGRLPADQNTAHALSGNTGAFGVAGEQSIESAFAPAYV